jgi:adenosylmethionine-8-amino-7-oxononanoate aminotransferase
VELVADRRIKRPLDVRRQEIAERVRDKQGVIVRSIYQNVIIAPCLILTPEEADQVATALHAVLSTTNVSGRPSPSGVVATAFGGG